MWEAYANIASLEFLCRYTTFVVRGSHKLFNLADNLAAPTLGNAFYTHAFTLFLASVNRCSISWRGCTCFLKLYFTSPDIKLGLRILSTLDLDSLSPTTTDHVTCGIFSHIPIAIAKGTISILHVTSGKWPVDISEKSSEVVNFYSI